VLLAIHLALLSICSTLPSCDSLITDSRLEKMTMMKEKADDDHDAEQENAAMRQDEKIMTTTRPQKAMTSS
jgi:hypothetical protein